MIQRLSKRFLSMLLVTVMILGLVPVIAAPAFAATSGTLTGLTDENIGLSFTGDADNAWSANGKTIIGSVKTEGDICGDTVYSSTLTITNNKGAKATLAFDYAVEQNSGTITVGGTDVTANSSYSAELDPGASTTVYIKSGSTSDATKITITNISLVSDVPVAVTFVPAENGTYAVDGKAITETWKNTQQATKAYELVATPDAGYKFFGWYNLDNGKCMSTDASTGLNIGSDCSFTARFVSADAAIFETGGQPFADLNEAVNYAVANSKNKITLIADGAISGNYDIPAGITLLIPFDDAGTLYTDSPAAIRTTPASKPFRTLTMTAGSSITVNGAISIGGRYYAAGGGQQGRPIGDHGYIKMASGSSITVKNGGNLYAWGFISGDGSVTAESGATVYEFYQIADFRGGSASSSMGNKVFPFSQYFIQNIEVPLTLNAGATEKVFSGVYAMSTTYTTTINFIGSGGMFNIKSGSFTKDYDESTDRLILTVNGEAELNTLALKLAGMSVNSANYVLPITNNITINIDSGSVTINQDTALLAGVEVNIAEGAGLTVASEKSVYVYDADEWNSDNFVWGSCKFKSVAYAPGKAYDRSNSDLTDAKINVDGTLTAIGAVYTTAGGADICSEGGTGKYIQQGALGTQTTTYQYNSSSNSKEFTITPAKLRNADGTYFKTATVKTGTTVNYYKDGGIWHVHNSVKVAAKEATCTEKGNTDGTKCSVCNKILSGVEEIPAKGHQWDEGSITTAPTCTEDGVKTFTCLVCDGTKTEKVEKKGHISAEAVKEKVVEPTCTVEGSYDEVVYCKECGKELSRVTKTIDALGHTPGEAKRENVVEPSCMVDGRYEEVVYCSVCNDEISRVTKKIEATGHTPVDVAEVPATCTKPGTAAGTKCDVCGEELSGFEAIPPAGHQWDEGKVTTEPTCEGTGVKTFTCTVCNTTKTETIDPKGHTPGAAVRENVVDSTCTVKGSYEEVVYCEACKKELSRETKELELDPDAHTPGAAVRENVVDSTCTVKGSYDEVVYCEACKKELSREAKVIEKKAHTPVDVAEVPATCTKPGISAGTKCGVCGEELSGFDTIPAKGHQWDEGKVTTEPTCEGTGVKTFTCSNCQEKRYEDIPATGHQWDEGKVTTEPKCEEAGVKTYTCKVCKETKTEAIDATGHTPVEVPEVPATCTEPGKKAGTKCSVCNKILSGFEEIPAKGHQWNDGEITTAPTCTEKGVKTYTCTVCNTTKTEAIDATGHTPVEVSEVPATCTKSGTTAGFKCDVCGATISGLETIPAAGHTPGEAKKENVKEATCTKDGSYDEVVRCKVCNEELSSTPKTITSPGHQWDEGVVTKEPTCAAEGEKLFTCSVCKETKTEKIDKTNNHTPGEAQRENVKEATCTKDGSYDEVVRCKVCNKELSREPKTITSPGHQWDDGVVTKEPTCAAEGEKTFTCSVCKETKTEKIDKTNNHTPGEAQRENVKEATCTKDGSYDEVVRCKVCNEELSSTPKTITSPGHQWDDGVATTEPKCEEAGVMTYTCKVCNETKTEAIDATGHTPVEVPEVPATCTEPGKKAGTKCSVCDTILSGFEEIPANGHQWNDGEITTAPTCTEKGVKTYTCSVCDETKTEAIDPKGHTPVDVAAKDATCTEKGNTAGTKCSVCNKILSGVEEIPAKGHTPGKAVKESVVLATCEAAGSYEEVVYCEVCKEELTRVSKTLPAMGHTRGKAVRENVIDSTCADEGSCDEVVYCEVCKKELSREAKVIEKKAHTPLDVAEVPATCTEPGTTAGTKCDVCGTILSGVKEIPANGHTEVIRNAKPATDTEDGYTGDVYCEVCNELLRNGEVIPATHVKITWIINGVKHETVCAKGEIPVYDGETPAKPETSRFTYEFKGWDKEIVAATENAEYTAEFTAIGKNGLCIEGNDTFWIKNGVNIAFPGLIRIADENGHIHYYYFAEDGKAVKNGNYKVNKNNGLPLPEYGFAFDSDGVIVHDEDTSKNGICDGDGDGSKFYYIDGVKVGEGLIKVGDYYYYARTSSGEIVRNRQYWITKTNELPIQQGIFDFDAEGRMIVTGFIHAFGATYYYDNGVLAKGFTKIGDDYYIFNASSGKMYSNAMMWVPDNEYGITGGMYEFDADGKMIRTGFITTGGYTYYYDNGVLAKGFTKIGDDYYFFNAGSGKMYRDATLWVADNAEYGFVGGMYYFGADGKMVLPDIENGKKSIVTINGKKYLTIDGAYAPTGLYEIDGNCYYVKAAGELAVGETVWVDNKNGLIPAKGDWRAFDAEGKLIHTGFVTGGDGYVYHYTDDVLSLGFTCIDGEYYLFNAGSGKMYRDANMWVGPNDYGIVGGMYYFDANGKMAR